MIKNEAIGKCEIDGCDEPVFLSRQFATCRIDVCRSCMEIVEQCILQNYDDVVVIFNKAE